MSKIAIASIKEVSKLGYCINIRSEDWCDCLNCQYSILVPHRGGVILRFCSYRIRISTRPGSYYSSLGKFFYDEEVSRGCS